MNDDLVQAARRAAEAAYAPYSRYRVGAAVRTAFGEIVTGCNVENASYGLALCAERNALFAARAAGLLDPESAPPRAIAIHAPESPLPRPCGACRQVMAEFAGDDLPVIIDGPGEQIETTLGALLPEAFRFKP